jgi:hypothetical protein
LVLNPLCKLINSHVDVLETSGCSLERVNHIKPLAGERPWWWDANEFVHKDVCLPSKELAWLAVTSQIFYIFECRRPVIAKLQNFTY